MSRLPSCTAAQVIRALKRAGFVFDHATGSHQDCFAQQLEPVEEAPAPSSSCPRKACPRKSVGRASRWGGAYAARWISAFAEVTNGTRHNFLCKAPPRNCRFSRHDSCCNRHKITATLRWRLKPRLQTAPSPPARAPRPTFGQSARADFVHFVGANSFAGRWSVYRLNSICHRNCRRRCVDFRSLTTCFT